MVNGPLADKLEYAILEVVFRNSEANHQDSFGGWETQVQALVPDYSNQADLRDAFKRLWDGGDLRLTKPDTMRRHAFDYSGHETDDSGFFFTGPFNAKATATGRKYWDGIKIEKKKASIGFHQP